MKTLSPDRLLQSQGFGSRKDCQLMIKKGLFSVDREVITDLKRGLSPVNSQGEPLIFALEGQAHQYREKVYLILNKPLGYECSQSPQHHQSIFELLPTFLVNRGIQSAGRLDQNTTGLLLLSDDGDFLHKITSPKSHFPKTYIAKTRDPLTPEQIDLLLSGAQLRGEEAPDRALAARALEPKALEITIDQGKYHQVRRMVAACGNYCVELERVSLGPWVLKDLGLQQGQWAYISQVQEQLRLQS